MKKLFKDIFFSHKDNNEIPHLATGKGVIVVTTLALLLLVLSSIQLHTLKQNDYFLSAVLPSILVDLSNEDRVENGLSPLRHNEVLARAAQMKADHMAANGYFAHVSPDGTTPWYWIDQAGYQFITAGENLAVHFTDSYRVEEAWMNSPLHRNNILNENYKEIGIAVAKGKFEGYDTIFVVQMFGTPASVLGAGVQSADFTAEPIVSTEFIPDDVTDVAGARVEQSFVSITRSDIPLEGTHSSGNVSDVEEHSTQLERFFSQPFTILQILYAFLAGVLVFTLISMLISEAREKHLLHIGYILLSLIILFFLFYVVEPLIFSETLVADIPIF